MPIGIVMLALTLVANGALHQHAKVHRRGHVVAQRAVEVDIVTVTEIVTVTVDPVIGTATTTVAEIESIPAPSAPVVVLTSVSSWSPATNVSQPPSVVPEPAATPTNDVQGSNLFKTLDTVPGSAILLNSCDYDVFVWSTGNPSCEGPGAACKRLEANGTHVEPLRKCSDGGVAMKISKSEDAANPMQFEYTVWSDHKTVSYDISYLNCQKHDGDAKNPSTCAGHDGGIQAVGGGDCKVFQCPAGQSCDAQAYTVPEFGYLPGPPVGGCTVDKGIAFELCAGYRV
jgi:hypothetical protein